MKRLKGGSWRSCHHGLADSSCCSMLCLGVFCLAVMFTAPDFAAAQTVPAPAPAAVLTEQNLESVLSSLRAAGLTSSAMVLQTAVGMGVATGGFSLPSDEFTIFAPTNAVLDAFLPLYPNIYDVFIYHTAAEFLPYDLLISLNTGTQIPTLLAGNQLVVTDNTPTNYFIDNKQVLVADLCNVSAIACHAVNGVFNSTVWGQAPLVPIEAPAAQPVAAPMGAPFRTPLPAPIIGGFSPLVSPIASPASSPQGAPGVPSVFPPAASASPLASAPAAYPGATDEGDYGPAAGPGESPGESGCNTHLSTHVLIVCNMAMTGAAALFINAFL